METQINYKAITYSINNSIAYYETDSSGHITKVNEKYCTLLQTSSRNIIKKKHKELVSDDTSKKKEYNEMWNNFQKGTPYTIPVDYIGTPSSLKETFTPIIINRKLEKVVVFVTDLTREQNVINQFKKLKNKYYSLEEESSQKVEILNAIKEQLSIRENSISNTINAINNTLGMFEMNFSKEIISVNKEYLQMLAQPEANIKGKFHNKLANISEIIQNEYKEMWEQVKNGTPHSLDIEYDFEGQKVWLHETYTPVKNKGKYEKVLVLTKDITNTKALTQKLHSNYEELQAQEEELRQNLEELQAVQDDLAERETSLKTTLNAIDHTLGSFEMNLKGEIIRANRKFSQMLKRNIQKKMVQYGFTNHTHQ